MDTLASLRNEVLDYIDERDDRVQVRADIAINDGIEKLWMRAMKCNLSIFMAGPIAVSIASDTQGVILVSIADPVTAPIVSDAAASDPALTSHTVDVAYSYVTESGTETKISNTTTHVTATGTVAAVHPPTIVTGAIGWNCYARTASTGSLVKQNEEPLQFLTTSSAYFNEPETGFSNDPALPKPPTENTTGDDICYIRQLEAQMPDGGWKSYQSADIASLLMQKMSRGVSISSEYQTYYWDLVNQRQLEFRPATGMAWNPRYFYIKRPRRLIYDNAALPFLTFPSRRFLRMFALSDLSLSIKEYEAADRWEKKAEIEALDIELTLVQQNHAKNQYITPFQ